MDQNVYPNIEDVASKTISVESTLRPQESSNAPFERQFTDPARNPCLGYNPAPHAIRSFQISDVVLDGEFRGLFNSNGFILGTGYLVPDEFMKTVAIDKARLVQAGDGSTVIIGCNVAHKNYFHWCTQALPAIDHGLQRVGQDRRVCIALPKLNSWQEETLSLLGYATIRRITIDDEMKQYALGRAEYSEFLNGGSAFSLSEVTYRTYSRLRQAVDAVSREGKKIYIARTDSPTRRMRNEAAIIDEVRSLGFEVVVPGALTLTEQIGVFRSAKLVVGPHGAGLTNIIFCEPGSIVYELLPAHYRNGCFCNLAHICRLRYWCDVFESEGEGLPNLREWESNTRSVVERLDEIGVIQLKLEEEAKRQTISAMDYLRGKVGSSGETARRLCKDCRAAARALKRGTPAVAEDVLMARVGGPVNSLATLGRVPTQRVLVLGLENDERESFFVEQRKSMKLFPVLSEFSLGASRSCVFREMLGSR